LSNPEDGTKTSLLVKIAFSRAGIDSSNWTGKAFMPSAYLKLHNGDAVAVGKYVASDTHANEIAGERRRLPIMRQCVVRTKRCWTHKDT
jgi:hypothetical protein